METEERRPGSGGSPSERALAVGSVEAALGRCSGNLASVSAPDAN